jgi:hypothetical protein
MLSSTTDESTRRIEILGAAAAPRVSTGTSPETAEEAAWVVVESIKLKSPIAAEIVEDFMGFILLSLGVSSTCCSHGTELRAQRNPTLT